MIQSHAMEAARELWGTAQISSVNGTQPNVRRYCELAVRRGLRIVVHCISVNIWLLLYVFQEPVANVFLWPADTHHSFKKYVVEIL